MTKAEEIYHRFVNYEWNEIGEGMKVSIIKAIDEALKEGQKLPIHDVSGSSIRIPKPCLKFEGLDNLSIVSEKPMSLSDLFELHLKLENYLKTRPETIVNNVGLIDGFKSYR